MIGTYQPNKRKKAKDRNNCGRIFSAGEIDGIMAMHRHGKRMDQC